MELLDEDKLAQFVRSIVIEMKPELKSDINKADVKRMIESSSREWLNAKQSANYLGVSVVTFREWRRKYKIPSRKRHEMEKIRFRCLLETQRR